MAPPENRVVQLGFKRPRTNDVKLEISIKLVVQKTLLKMVIKKL